MDLSQAVRSLLLRSSPPQPTRPRPPGPEQGRGVSASSRGNGQEPHPPSIGDLLRSPRTWIMLVVFWIFFSLVIPLLFPQTPPHVTVSYTFFVQQVQAGNVKAITAQGTTIQGTFKTPVTLPSNPQVPAFTLFQTEIPTFADNRSLDNLLQSKQVIISSKSPNQPSSALVTLLIAFGPSILLIAGFLWIQSRAQSMIGGGAFGFGRSRARRYDAGEMMGQRVTFADVAGIDEVKAELEEIVDYLRDPAKYQRLGGTVPKGVLLVGPPGTGKTLLARAVAGEASVPFFSISGSEFIEMIVGVGAARVRDLFAQAKAAAPAIIFVDELDAIGRRRGAGNIMGGNDEREQTLNQLLVEMDGFDARQAVIVLAATNRADVLDPALLRPGRFDRRVIVQPPDRAGRAAILRVHTRGVPLDPSVDFDQIAAETPGLVGADLRNLINEAALLAARKGRDRVMPEDFTESLEKIALGAERKISLSPEDRERIAYHEAGHALVGLLQPEGDPVRRVTVVPRGQALGVTLSIPEADRYNLTESYLRARITSALGGRAAEQVIYGSMTTGAENDLKQVTHLARAMVMRWGMSPEVGLVQIEGADEGNFLEGNVLPTLQRPLSEQTAQAVDRAVRRIIDECYEKAVELLTQERPRLDHLAQALLKEEALDEQEILQVTGLAKEQHKPIYVATSPA